MPSIAGTGGTVLPPGVGISATPPTVRIGLDRSQQILASVPVGGFATDQVQSIAQLTKLLSKMVQDGKFNDNPDEGRLNVRKAAIGAESKKYGRIWLGLQEMAKDNINKDTVIIKGRRY